MVGGRRPWRECVNVRTWYILHTYFFVPEATKDGKIVNPAVDIFDYVLLGSGKDDHKMTRLRKKCNNTSNFSFRAVWKQ